MNAAARGSDDGREAGAEGAVSPSTLLTVMPISNTLQHSVRLRTTSSWREAALWGMVQQHSSWARPELLGDSSGSRYGRAKLINDAERGYSLSRQKCSCETGPTVHWIVRTPEQFGLIKTGEGDQHCTWDLQDQLSDAPGWSAGGGAAIGNCIGMGHPRCSHNSD